MKTSILRSSVNDYLQRKFSNKLLNTENTVASCKEVCNGANSHLTLFSIYLKTRLKVTTVFIELLLKMILKIAIASLCFQFCKLT